MSKASEVLQRAFEADGNALQALISHRVPCNQNLADDPLVQVSLDRILSQPVFLISTIGLVNAVLQASGLPRIAAKWSCPVGDEKSTLLGFCDYDYDVGQPE